MAAGPKIDESALNMDIHKQEEQKKEVLGSSEIQ